MCEGLPFDFDTLAKRRIYEALILLRLPKDCMIYLPNGPIKSQKGSLRQMELHMLFLLFRK